MFFFLCCRQISGVKFVLFNDPFASRIVPGGEKSEGARTANKLSSGPVGFCFSPTPSRPTVPCRLLGNRPSCHPPLLRSLAAFPIGRTFPRRRGSLNNYIAVRRGVADDHYSSTRVYLCVCVLRRPVRRSQRAGTAWFSPKSVRLQFPGARPERRRLSRACLQRTVETRVICTTFVPTSCYVFNAVGSSSIVCEINAHEHSRRQRPHKYDSELALARAL